MNDSPWDKGEDIGGGHLISRSFGRIPSWPELFPETTYTDDDGVPVTLVGIIDWHLRPDGIRCGGSVGFCHPTNPSERESQRPTWTVESLDPLTLSPSILCAPDKGGCGSHGFIKQGRWVEA